MNKTIVLVKQVLDRCVECTFAEIELHILPETYIYIYILYYFLSFLEKGGERKI